MFFFPDTFWDSPVRGFALLLCLVNILWASRLLTTRKSGPDRLILAIVGMVSIALGARLLQESGIWSSPLASRAQDWATLSVVTMCLTAVHLVWRWSRDHFAAAAKLRIHEGTDDIPAATPMSGSGLPELTRTTPSTAAEEMGRDRRRRLRVPLQRPVLVEVLDASHQELSGCTIDFSGDGLGMQVGSPIGKGVVILVRAEEGLLLGEVTNCREVNGAYRVGLRVDQFLAPTVPAVGDVGEAAVSVGYTDSRRSNE